MTHKVFNLANNVNLLCIKSEAISVEYLTNLIHVLPNDKINSTDNSAGTKAATIIQTIRFIECTIDAASLQQLLTLPELRAFEFQDTSISPEAAIPFYLALLQKLDAIEVKITHEKEKTDPVNDPFALYRWLLNWRKHWWIYIIETTPDNKLETVKTIQSLVIAATVLQMRFFILMQGQDEASIVGSPDWKKWHQDLHNYLINLKKAINHFGNDPYSQALRNNYKDLYSEMCLFDPPLTVEFEDPTFYHYFSLLYRYRKMRFFLTELSYFSSIGKESHFKKKEMTELINEIKANQKTQREPSIVCLHNAILSLIYRFHTELFDATEQARNTALEAALTELEAILELKLKKKIMHDSWVAPLNFDIFFGLLCYFKNIDFKVIESFSQTNADLAQSILEVLLELVFIAPESFSSKLVCSMVFNHFIRAEFQLEDNRKTGYVQAINALITSYTQKIIITNKQPPLRISCCHSDQLWLLEFHFKQIMLFANGAPSRLFKLSKPFAVPQARQHMSLQFHMKNPLQLSLLKWEQRIGPPLFQPAIHNRILDTLTGFQAQRILFEKLMHYFFLNLSEVEKQIIEFRSIVNQRKSDNHPTFVLDPHTAICGIRKNTELVHYDLLIQLAITIRTLIPTDSAKSFRIPSVDKLNSYPVHELEYALCFFKKVFMLGKLLLDETIKHYILTGLSQEYGLELIKETTNTVNTCVEKHRQLDSVIHDYQKKCAEHQDLSWLNHISNVDPTKRRVRCLKPIPKQSNPKKAKAKESEKKAVEIVAKEPVSFPSYLIEYPVLKPIYFNFERADYQRAQDDCQAQIKSLVPDDSVIQSQDPSHFPVLAYLYYALAESIRMLANKDEIDQQLVFHYLAQGYHYYQNIIALNLEINSELMEILNFLAQDVESSSFYYSHQSNPAVTPTDITQNTLPVTFQCELTPPIRSFLQMLFKHFSKEQIFFYGSFVTTTLIRAMHPNLTIPPYRDVDIAIFCDDLDKAYAILAKLLPHFYSSKYRTGLYRGKYEKTAFDIQIVYAKHYDPMSFAKKLGIAARAGMADSTGKCFDYTGKTFPDIMEKVARFLDDIDFQKNPLAILNHLRTQAEYGFCSNELDDKRIAENIAALSTWKNCVLRDYFSRHFQRGYAQKSLALWYHYKIFSVLYPEISTLPVDYFQPVCQQLDADYSLDHVLKMDSSLLLIARFLVVVTLSKKPTPFSLQPIIDLIIDTSQSPLIVDLPLVAKHTLTGLVRYGIKQAGFFANNTDPQEAEATTLKANSCQPT